ncbi:MAG: hypothetical protein UR43_C0015G0010 [candidate division TM6 bacterium GW2011_GWF2_33_332]|nr:MAG: hypothetical protein UR43_C0015G0010 [candidate division TM6 bacterium GW2011_GWF2_33_332]
MSWTIKTLKKYFEQKFKDMSKARKLARKLMNTRLNGMNNIHLQLVKQNETFVNKDEMKLVEREIKSLSRLVYIGLGVWLLLQPIIMYILTLLYKR